MTPFQTEYRRIKVYLRYACADRRTPTARFCTLDDPNFHRTMLPVCKSTGFVSTTEMTVIVDPPPDQTVDAGSDVTFRCGARTDREEVSKLTVEWWRDGKPMRHPKEERYTSVGMDSWLRLADVQLADIAGYTCRAGNGLDTVDVTARLIVKGHVRRVSA